MIQRACRAEARRAKAGSCEVLFDIAEDGRQSSSMTPEKRFWATRRPRGLAVHIFLLLVLLLGNPDTRASSGVSSLVTEAWSVQQTAAGAGGNEAGPLAADSAGNLFVASHSSYGSNYLWNIL